MTTIGTTLLPTTHQLPLTRMVTEPLRLARWWATTDSAIRSAWPNARRTAGTQRVHPHDGNPLDPGRGRSRPATCAGVSADAANAATQHARNAACEYAPDVRH